MFIDTIKTEPVDFIEGCNELANYEEATFSITIKKEEPDFTENTPTLLNVDEYNISNEIKKEQINAPEKDHPNSFGNFSLAEPIDEVKKVENLMDFSETPNSEKSSEINHGGFVKDVVFKSCGRFSDVETTPAREEWDESSESDEDTALDKNDPDYCVESSSESSDNEENNTIEEDNQPLVTKLQQKRRSADQQKQDDQTVVTKQLKIPNKDFPYPCPVEKCTEEFKTRTHRQNHIKTEHDNLVSCPYNGCKSRLKSTTFDHHLKVIHEKLYPDILCERCGKFIVYMYENEHKDRCRSDGTKKHHCTQPNCNAAFSTVNGLGQHIRNSHKPKYDCPVIGCGVKLKPAYVSTHLKVHHNDHKRTCDKCGKVMSLHSLRRHVKICKNDGKKTFRCTEEGCDELFLTTRYRSEHVRTVHAPLTQCPREGCEAVVKASGLRKHIQRVHDNVEKKKCDRCKKQVKISSFRKHEKRCGDSD